MAYSKPCEFTFVICAPSEEEAEDIAHLRANAMDIKGRHIKSTDSYEPIQFSTYIAATSKTLGTIYHVTASGYH